MLHRAIQVLYPYMSFHCHTQFSVSQSLKPLKHIKLKSTLVHSDGISGIFQNFARFLLIIHKSAQLSLPDRSISWPKHQKWSLLVPLPCWIFVSELLLIFSKSIFFICLLFNYLNLQFWLEFKLHENREFVYFATPPAQGTMAGTESVLNKYSIFFVVKQMHEWVFMKNFS